jgi:hypothetical protein
LSFLLAKSIDLARLDTKKYSNVMKMNIHQVIAEKPYCPGVRVRLEI